MTIGLYEGETAIITAGYADFVSAPVTFSVRLPDGTLDGPITMDSLGGNRYSGQYTTTMAGVHFVRIETAPPVVVAESFIDVRPSRVV